MKTQTQENFAFIDSQNVYLSLKSYGFKIDWKRFRVYLKEHYSVSTAYIFLGYIEGNNDLYSALQQAGFICVFKPVLKYRDGTIKGNVDAELVLHAMHHLNDYNQAIIVSGDGDFYCLIQYLLKLGKLKTVLIPNRDKYSALLKRFAGKHIAFMNDLISKVGTRK